MLQTAQRIINMALGGRPSRKQLRSSAGHRSRRDIRNAMNEGAARQRLKSRTGWLAYGADQAFWGTVLVGAGALSGGDKVNPTQHDLHRPRVKQSREQELRPGYSKYLPRSTRIYGTDD